MAESTFDASLRAKALSPPSPAANWAATEDWPTPHIRMANLGDLEQLTEVLASSFYDRTGWLAWLYPLAKLGIQEDLKQRLKLNRTHYACLAIVVVDAANYPGEKADLERADRGQIVGTVEIAQRQSWPWQGTHAKYAYISNLAVDPGFRRRGLAAQLLTACESLALAWQLDHLYLHVMEDNPGARRLYRRAGFEVFQTEETLAVWLGLQPRRLLLQKTLLSTPRGDMA